MCAPAPWWVLGGVAVAARRSASSLVRSGSRAVAGRGLVAGQGVSQGLVQRGGVDGELASDLGAVDDEGLQELVLQLHQLPHGGVDDAQGSQEERWGTAELGLGLAGEPVDD